MPGTDSTTSGGPGSAGFVEDPFGAALSTRAEPEVRRFSEGIEFDALRASLGMSAIVGNAPQLAGTPKSRTRRIYRDMRRLGATTASCKRDGGRCLAVGASQNLCRQSLLTFAAHPMLPLILEASRPVAS